MTDLGAIHRDDCVGQVDVGVPAGDGAIFRRKNELARAGRAPFRDSSLDLLTEPQQLPI